MERDGWSPRRLEAPDARQLDELADLTIDAVAGGASVSFMHPLSRDRAVTFWRPIAEEARAGQRALPVAEDAAAEQADRACGKTLLVLDTETGGDADRLYQRLGWVRVGVIPGYALLPRGGLGSTTVSYRPLGEA